MKVFVTGACGQVGSHVSELFLARGDSVFGIDNFATGRRLHLPNDGDNLQFVEGDISDKDTVHGIIEDYQPDVIVHTAASYKDPDDWYNDTLTNCVGGANLIQAAKKFNVQRFIYFQTALCYGLHPEIQPIPLDHSINPDNSSYSISKTTTEQYLQLSGLDFVTFRLANVVGPRNVSGPLPIFYDRLKQLKGCFVTKARRDFVFVGDLAKYTVKAADGVGNGTYHFSSGKDIEIIELYDAVVDAMKLPEYPTPDVRELGPDDAPTILLDPARTFQDFGDIEFTPIRETVAKAVEYFDEHGVHGGYTHLSHKEASS